MPDPDNPFFPGNDDIQRPPLRPGMRPEDEEADDGTEPTPPGGRAPGVGNPIPDPDNPGYNDGRPGSRPPTGPRMEAGDENASDRGDTPSEPSKPAQAPVYQSIPEEEAEKRRDELRERVERGEATHDTQYTQDRHTADGKEVQRDLRRGRDAHIFNDDIDLKELEKKVLEEGTYQGVVPGDKQQWERIIYKSPVPIGRRIKDSDSDKDLYWVEIKGKQLPDGSWEYHLVPRSQPAAPQ